MTMRSRGTDEPVVERAQDASDPSMGRPSSGRIERIDLKMRPARSILWQFPQLPSMERCALIEGADVERFEGTVLTLLDGEPTEIHYSVTCDAAWQTRSCTVTIESHGSTKTIRLEVDERGSWTRDGVRANELDGAADVDLGFSPCTNTLAIRRLALDIGQHARITVAWLRFPELDIIRSEQVYTRLTENTYRYESGTGDFRAELDVDEHGIVTRYGDYWREILESDLQAIDAAVAIEGPVKHAGAQ